MARKRATQEVDTARIENNAKSLEVAIFAKTLNTLLEDRGMHQTELAEKTGIAQATISSYRNGLQEPKMYNLIKIAECLGVDCHYLMTGIQAKNYISTSELGLSEAAIRRLKELRSFPVFRRTSNDFICSDCFRQIIAYLFNFRERMVGIVALSEDPAAEYGDLQEKFSAADLMEYYASKNLSNYFDRIKEEELSKSSTLVKKSDGYGLRIGLVNKGSKGERK